MTETRTPAPWWKVIAHGYLVSLLLFVSLNVSWTLAATYVAWGLVPVWQWEPCYRGWLLALSNVPLAIRLIDGAMERCSA